MLLSNVLRRFAGPIQCGLCEGLEEIRSMFDMLGGDQVPSGEP